jgi:hypothetical protein
LSKNDALSPAFLKTLIVSEYSSADATEPPSVSTINSKELKILFTM